MRRRVVGDRAALLRGGIASHADCYDGSMRPRIVAIALALPLACAPAAMGPPPELSDRDPVDSEVRERVSELVQAVRDKPDDADLREQLARTYQANGLPDLAEATW